MNISRNSWHYRLADFALDFFGKSPSNSLCLYFWQVVFAPVILLGGLGIILFAVLALLVLFLYGIGAILNDMMTAMHILPMSFKQLPGIFNYRAVITSVLIDAALTGFVAYKLYRESNPKTEVEESEQNFVIAFVKAKKQKICPFINFKD